jgi:hypothetical protein
MEYPTSQELLEARHFGIDTSGLDRKALQECLEKARQRHRVANPNVGDYFQLTIIAHKLGLDTPYGERLEDRKHRVEECLIAMFNESGIRDGAFVRYADNAPNWAGLHTFLPTATIEWYGSVPYVTLLQGDTLTPCHHPAHEVALHAYAIA